MKRDIRLQRIDTKIRRTEVMSKKKEDEKLNDCYQELFKTVVDMQASITTR